MFAADGGWLAHFPLPIAQSELGNSMNRSSLPPDRHALEFLKYYVVVCLRGLEFSLDFIIRENDRSSVLHILSRCMHIL